MQAPERNRLATLSLPRRLKQITNVELDGYVTKRLGEEIAPWFRHSPGSLTIYGRPASGPLRPRDGSLERPETRWMPFGLFPPGSRLYANHRL